MSKKNPGRIDCACVIHGSGYDWQYVEKLYNMLSRNLSAEVRLHVYTEHDRSVPPHMVKHILEDWGISGPKRSWWYKMQLFNPAHFTGNLLYFDLDVVIANQLNWVRELSTDYLWTIRDFRYLQRRDTVTMNSRNLSRFNSFSASSVISEIFSMSEVKIGDILPSVASASVSLLRS
jgi:hypothetical protein